MSVALLAGVVSGCTGQADRPAGDRALSLSPFVAKARAAHRSGAKSCPVGYDLGKVASQIGAGGQAGPEQSGDAVDVETADDAGNGSPLARLGGAVLTCRFRIAADEITVYTVGVRQNDSAVDLMVPQINADAHLGLTALNTWLRTAQDAKRGTATVTPSGNVAAVRLPVDGTGDIALVVSEGTNGHTPIGAAKVKPLAEGLAAQAAW